MIHMALKAIKDKLELYLKVRFGLDQNIAILNQLVEHDGKELKQNQNKVVITLINLDHETNQQYIGSQQRSSTSSFLNINPAIHFNMDLLFTAIFDDYEEALKFLNATISFFQANNSINNKNTPELPAGIKSLKFEIENSNYHQIHSLWSAMGAKYQPSIIYKVRHVTVQADQVATVSQSVSDVASNVSLSHE